MSDNNLELLKRCRNLLSHPMSWWKTNLESRERLVGELDRALHQTPQEPVAWRTKNATPPGGYVVFQQYPSAVADLGGEIEPLYTAPPHQEPRLRYDILHEYADLHKLNYNDLCRVVRDSLTKEKTND